MLDRIRRGQRWLTMLFIGVIGVVFVFFIGLGGPLSSGLSGGAIVELDDIRLDLSDFERIRAREEQRYRDALGDQFDVSGARDFLNAQALQSLIQSAILTHSAQELGLVVSKKEIQQLLRASPQFRDANGRFAREAFESWAEYTYGSQRNFLRVQRREMLRRKMIRLLYSQTQVSDGEARAAALHRLEEVEIAFVALDMEQLPPDLGADEAAALAYLSANQGAVRAAYEAETDAYAIPERVRASHILFRLDRDANETAADVARELAEAALARLQAGEDFAEIAVELSEDPGSRDRGGDLGIFGRGDRRPELEQAAFALEPGQLSEIVQTDAGLHIIRLDERLEAGRKSFDEVSTEIARELADAELARERADLISQQLATATREGQSLESAARGLELPIERPDPLRRRADGFITGLGVAPELMAAIFALTQEQPSSDRIFQAGTKLVLVQLLARPELEPAALEQVIASERTRLLNLKRDQAIQDWIDFDRRTLADSGRLLIDSSPVTGS